MKFHLLKLSFFIILINACSLIKHHPGKYYKKAKLESYDVAIVPGYPFGGEHWNDVIKYRLLWAKHLYEKKLVKNFVFSGSAVNTKYNEGFIMAMYAYKMGIAKENIFIEPYAEHSSENIYYSLKICKEQGFRKIAVATDPIQSFLLTNYVDRIKNIQVDYLILQPRFIREHKFYDEPSINSTLAIEEGFVPLKERKNYWQRKKASLGLSIDYGMKVSEYLYYSKWLKW
jgi:hypothetical protein